MDAGNQAIHRRKLESPNAQIEMPMGNSSARTEKEEPSHLAQGTPTSFGWRDTAAEPILAQEVFSANGQAKTAGAGQE